MHRRERSNMYPQRGRTPSSLLDSIYHSIDESNSNIEENNNIGKKQRMNLRQAVMIEDWMEKQRSSAGLFSSSEKTYKTSKLVKRNDKQQQKARDEHEGGGGFARALEIYQKAKQQPISPGRISRIAAFLTSIFSSENVKKAKMCYVGGVQDVSFHEHKKSSKSPPTCSFSRKSCMSKKTPSSSARSNIKRSVRFYPVSVILGEEDSNQPTILPLSSSAVRKITSSSSIREELKKNNVMAKENGVCKGEFDFRELSDDDEDALSYSSSDLFELDHLIGAERYQEELPVYETTNFETNKAIAHANGMLSVCL